MGFVFRDGHCGGQPRRRAGGWRSGRTRMMTGTGLDHRLVRDYLRELDAALATLPAARARELKAQLSAHLDEALRPDAADADVAATLGRLGLPADLAAEAGAAPVPLS